MRGSWRPNITATFWLLLLFPSTLCLSRSPDAQPETQRPSSLLDDGFLYCILSATSLVPKLHPSPFGLLLLSLPHLVLSFFNCHLTSAWLSYIIVQRPLDHPFDLWNGMIDRHPAEITVMQFTDHSLPVHQSMSVSSALPCAISSAKSTHAISFDYWPLECVTSFRCITLLWRVYSGRRSKYNITIQGNFHQGKTYHS